MHSAGRDSRAVAKWQRKVVSRAFVPASFLPGLVRSNTLLVIAVPSNSVAEYKILLPCGVVSVISIRSQPHKSRSSTISRMLDPTYGLKSLGLGQEESRCVLLLHILQQ